jgi:hypothetical protein
MKSSVSLLHWLPRAICMLSIIFVSLFAFDAFSPEYALWQQVARFIVHLSPSFILLGLLVIAWKWELLGGALLTLVGLGLSPLIYQHNYTLNQSIAASIGIVMMITLPLVVAGVLFMASYFKKKKNS